LDIGNVDEFGAKELKTDEKCEIFSGDIYSIILELKKETIVFVKVRKSEKTEFEF